MAESTSARPDTQLFRDAFNASPIGIAVENLDGQPLFVNPAFCRFLGFTEEELRRKHCVDFSPKEDAEKDWTLFQQLRAGSIDHYQLEKRYFRRDGSLVWGRLSLSLLNNRPSPLVIAMVEDITDKKGTEEALREGEERLRLAAQAGRMFAYSWDAATDVIERSGESAEILGVKSDQAATGAAIWAMVHPDDKQRLEAALSNLNVENPTLQITYRITRPDRTVTWVERNSRAYFDAEGKLKRVVGMVADVTERKRAEQALRESEQRFRLAAQAGRMYSFDWDVTTDVVLRSSERADILGLAEPLRLTHTQFLEKMFSDDRQTLIATIAGLTPKQPTAEIIYRMQNSDGGLVWLRSTGRAFFNAEGKLQRVIGMVADITDLKQAEEALRLSEERLRLAQQAARIGTFEWNIQTGVNTWTPELEAMHGLSPGAFPGTQKAFENLVHPDDLAGVIELIDRSLKSGRPDTGEWRVVWPDGSVHWIAARWQVLMTESGEPSRMVGVNMDITERKRAEDALAGMTRKLIEAQEQERSRIGRELHDDINQRLAMLAVELEQPHDASEFRNRVQGFREELRQISDDVQALSHDLHSSKLEYLGVVAGIKSWCKEFAERQKMDVDFKSDLRSVLPLDIGRPLFRVLQEALHNSFKHSGVKRIEVRLREDSGEIHLTISDLGKGFDLEAALQGKGLGLTSMRERVRLVNGTISVESKPMGGTTIHVGVPFGTQQSSQREAV